MSSDENPYAPPMTDDAGWMGGEMSEAERIRRQYLNHEASVKSIGTLYLVGAIAMTVVSVPATFLGPPAGPWELGVLIGLIVLFFCVGRGLRRLQRWTRVPVVVLAVIGLFQFPLGTIINAYILYLMLSPKSAYVMSDEYRTIIEQTPHIRYRSWGCLVVLLIVIVAFVALALVSPFWGLW